MANAKTDQDLVDVYNKLVAHFKIKPDVPARVVFARDTRVSGPALVASLVDALGATNAEYTDYGIFTTPQLHYIVRSINTQDAKLPYGEPTEDGYYEKLGEAFKIAMKHRKTNGSVTVDCANGVGGPKLRKLLKYIPAAASGGVDVKVVNDDVSRPEMLNVQVSVSYNDRAAGFFSLNLSVRCRLCQNSTASTTFVQGRSKRSLRVTRW